MKIVDRINYHYNKRRNFRRGYVYVRPVTELDQFVGNLGHKSVTAAKNISLLYAGALAQEFSKSLTNKAVKKVTKGEANAQGTYNQSNYNGYQQQQASSNFFSNSGGYNSNNRSGNYNSQNYDSLGSGAPW